MKIIITGADGFVGSNLIRELLTRNHEIVAFVKDGQDAKSIKDLNIDIKYGDILKPETLAKAIKGCDALIHTAALTSMWPYRSEIQKKVNIEGTRNVMEAVLNSGLKRVIHISTANSFGYGSKTNPGDETKQYLAGKYKMDYMDTKFAAQELVSKMVREDNLPAIIVNPTFMFGPHASTMGSAKMIELVYNGKIPGFTIGGRNYIAVKDVCVAIANALEMGEIGEKYILGNENLNYKEIFSAIAEVTGVKAPKLFITKFMATVYGKTLTILGKTFNFEPSVSYPMALMSCEEQYYQSNKAIKELGLPQTPIKTALKEAFNWLQENNRCIK